jgi:hypothetical protein
MSKYRVYGTVTLFLTREVEAPSPLHAEMQYKSLTFADPALRDSIGGVEVTKVESVVEPI